MPLAAAKRVLVVLVAISLITSFQVARADARMMPIDHIIVLYEENRTFDNYFGTYPGANGLNLNVALPKAPNSTHTIKPFHITNLSTLDLSHHHFAAVTAYDNGKMDGFVYAEDSELTMGYYDYREIPYYWDYASEFVLCDNFFTSMMGPSLPNHLFLIAGQSGGLYDNTNNFSLNIPVVMDQLDARGVSWKYYYNGRTGYTKEGLWNPLPGIQSFKNNTLRLKAHLSPNDEFLSDIKDGNLASVVWVMPLEHESEHAPYNVSVGEHYVTNLVNTIMRSEYWSSCAIFITWDDYGGWYDHVPPPQLDSYGLGFRTACLVISPFAKKGYIDNTQNEFCSILKFIETRFNLAPLTQRDANANNMTEAFDFAQAPRGPLILPGLYIPNHYPLTSLNLLSRGWVVVPIGVATVVAICILAYYGSKSSPQSKHGKGSSQQRGIRRSA